MATILSDRDMLLAAIRANPVDAAPRAALADWCLEHREKVPTLPEPTTAQRVLANVERLIADNAKLSDVIRELRASVQRLKVNSFSLPGDFV